MDSLPKKKSKNISHKPTSTRKDGTVRKYSKRSKRRKRRHEVKHSVRDAEVSIRPKAVQKRPAFKAPYTTLKQEKMRKLAETSSALINAQIDVLAAGFHMVIGCGTQWGDCPVASKYETFKEIYEKAIVNIRHVAVTASEGRCFCCYGPPTCWINCKYGGIFLRNSKKHRKSNTPACWDCLSRIVWYGNGRKMFQDPLTPTCPLCRSPGKKSQQGQGWTAILGRRYPKKKLKGIYYEDDEYPRIYYGLDSTLPEMPLQWKGLTVNKIMCRPSIWSRDISSCWAGQIMGQTWDSTA